MDVVLALILGLIIGALGGVGVGKTLKPKKKDEDEPTRKRSRLEMLEDRVAELEHRKK